MAITFEDEDGVEHVLPSKKEICSRCAGEGKHTNPSIDGHGISEEEFQNEWSSEEREDYMSGVYDVTCEDCNGLRVVDVLDVQKCNKKILKQYRERERSKREIDHILYMERMMGA